MSRGFNEIADERIRPVVTELFNTHVKGLSDFLRDWQTDSKPKLNKAIDRLINQLNDAQRHVQAVIDPQPSNTVTLKNVHDALSQVGKAMQSFMLRVNSGRHIIKDDPDMIEKVAAVDGILQKAAGMLVNDYGIDKGLITKNLQDRLDGFGSGKGYGYGYD